MERPYVYQALTPPHSIRLLRLLPDTNADGPLRGSLFECNIEEFYGHPNAYEALSYVWGDPKLSHSISIDGFKLPITANLHTALANLRSPYIERLLWADAMCINQMNEREKEWQIGLMYQIYACASCVVVWLGEHENGSEHICEDLLFIREKKPAQYQFRAFLSDRIIKFFQRAWFRRVWVLQEVGAARRVQIRWGNSTMDGIALSAAATSLLSRFQQVGEAREDSQKMPSVARFIPYLIQGSPFRLTYQGRKGPSDGVCSFAGLVDMFHKGEASKIHDKVYALLAMSTEDMGASGLVPDYSVPFGKLLKRVASTVISDKMSVNHQSNIDAVVIKTTGYVIAAIQRVRDDLPDPYLQRIDINRCHSAFNMYDEFSLSDLESSADDSGENKQRFFRKYWYIQASAIPIRKGDLVCYFDGSTRPTIIRVCQDYSIIIVAAVSRNKMQPSDSRDRLGWREYIKDQNLPKLGFPLVWDWSYSSGSHFETYAAWAQSRAWVSDPISTMATQKNIDDLVRRYDCALIHTAANGIGPSEVRFREVLSGFESVLQAEESHTRRREVFLAFLDRPYSRDVTMSSHAPDESYKKNKIVQRHIREMCRLAAEECCRNLTRFLVETLQVEEFHMREEFIISTVARAGLSDLVREKTHTRYEIHIAFESAALGGHVAVIEYLLEAAHTKELQIDEAINCALVLAAGRGHLAAFEELLQAGANVNTQARMAGRRSMGLLEAAVEGGNSAIFGLLLQAKSHENQVWSPSELQAALSAAARAGHCSTVELLIQAGADVNKHINWVGRPLVAAATGGHLSTVERLIQAGADVNLNNHWSETPLIAAATGGHLSVVKRLIQTGADIDLSPSPPCNEPPPLIAASIAGHLSVVTCLLEAGADPKVTYTEPPPQRRRRRSMSPAITPPKVKLVARTAREHASKNGHYAVAERLYEFLEAKNDNQRRSRMEATYDTLSNEESSSGDESRSLAIKKHFRRIEL